MFAAQRWQASALAVMVVVAAQTVYAQTVRTEIGADGRQYQVTTRETQVPVTDYREQQQTYYRQQLKTETQQTKQKCRVPVTQYKLVTRIHGRWNPFVTPYTTYHYEPETVWQEQVATVSVPVTRMVLVPETRTVRTPVTTYRTATTTTRVPLGASATNRSTALAANPGPTATLAARPSAAPSAAPLVAQRQPPSTSQTLQPIPQSPSAAPGESRYGSVSMPDTPSAKPWSPPDRY